MLANTDPDKGVLDGDLFLNGVKGHFAGIWLVVIFLTYSNDTISKILWHPKKKRYSLNCQVLVSDIM